MINQIVHRTIRLAPAMLVTIGLVAFLLFLTASSALGQTEDSSTATPSATSTPTAGTPTPEADPEEPDDEDDGGVSGSGGSGRVPTLTLSGLAGSLDKGRSREFTLAGSTLRTDATYKVRVSRPDGNTTLGFNSNCSDGQDTESLESGSTSDSHRFTLYGCSAGGGTITAELLENERVIDDKTKTVSVIGEPGKVSTPDVSGKVNGKLEISWDAPSSDGGSDITSYKVRYWRSSSSSTEVSASANDRSKTITGLTNGASYRAQVRACNRIGCGAWSRSASGTPYTTPDEVEDLSIDEEGDRSLEVEWDEPDDDGGSDITRYEVQYKRTTLSSWRNAGSTTSESKTITGLTNGLSYHVQVQACNAAGCGNWSDPPVRGTPHTTPDEVEDLSIDEEGDRSLEVEWDEPDDDGGSDITRYEVQYKRTTLSSWRNAGSTTSESKTITGLTNGLSYHVQVQACNAAGCGNWSDPPVRGTPHTTPDEVEDLSIDEEGDRSLEVEWDEPDDDGGSDITRYEVQYKRTTASSSAWSRPPLSTTSESKTITGLTNGRSYHVQVRACNAAGCGGWSSSVTGTPHTTPDEVEDLSIEEEGDRSLDVEWDEPDDDGGSDIIRYEVQYKRTTASSSAWRNAGSTTSESKTITGLTNGRSYHVQVRACNDAGCGIWSSSVRGTPQISATAPDKVSTPTVSAGNRSLSVSWTAPPNGGSAITSYKIQYKLTSVTSWTNAGSATGTSKTIDSLTNGSSYHVQVQACNTVGCGSWSNSPTGTPSAELQVSVSADRTELLAGETVTLSTAVSNAPSGASPSYDWQSQLDVDWSSKFTGPQYSNLQYKNNKIESLNWRVVVTYGSTASATSDPITITWSEVPWQAYITADDDAPASGDSVTMTAVVENAPSGATYQWQQRSGDTWSNLGSASTSSSKSVSFDSRGTRKFRVNVGNSRGASANSEPVYITWDETAIAGDMVEEMSNAVKKTTVYKNAARGLLTCMNPPADGATGSAAVIYGSVNDILGSYTGTTRTKMDGTCSSYRDDLFDAFEDESGNALDNMTGEYADLLETPDGARFASTIGDEDVLKQHLSLLAVDINAGTSGDSPASSPPGGLNCFVPAEGVTEPALLAGKMGVLTCLIFQTSHEFWVTQASKTVSSNDLKTSGRYDWLGYGPDWGCTDPVQQSLPKWLQSKFPGVITPQGAKPSCVKHDVAFASLQEFVPDTPAEQASKILDTSWNPRNKHLADAKFQADLLKYGCEVIVESLPDDTFCNNKGLLIGWMHWGVNKINNKKWPVTEQDIEHSEGSRAFVECEIPKLSGITLSRQDRGVRVNWTYNAGCVSGITVDYYRFCWTAQGTHYNQRTRISTDASRSDCTTHDPADGRLTIAIPSYLTTWSSLTLNTVQIRPDDIVYGGPLGFETLLSEKFFDPITKGAYYPPQAVNVIVSNTNTE